MTIVVMLTTSSNIVVTFASNLRLMKVLFPGKILMELW